MGFVSGQAVAVPDLERLAEAAAAIHDVDGGHFPHRYFPWYAAPTSNPPAASTRPALWEKAVELWHEAMPPCPATFIHRDFHPGNVLWWRGRVSGVVDWANACVGPSGCDVAHCRGNLIDLGGPEVADRFVASYESLTGKSFHPYWKLASILEAGPSYWTPERLTEQEPHLARAVAELTSKMPQG
jgi:aminoglycoside phosphotransferase (APT) family kinase protein